MFLWDKNSILEALKDEIINLPDKIEVTNVVFDSRRISDNALFLARKGTVNDGHSFIKQVLEINNTTYILSERIPENVTEINRIILVKNVDVAIERMAIYRRNQLNGKVIAITGSVGKTTTKELMYKTLSFFGKSHCNMMSFNNLNGILITLLNTPIDVKYAIFEIGVDAVGQLLKLAKLVKPDISIIKNIENAHFANFNSLEEIAQEKTEIIKATKECVFLNIDSNYYSYSVKKSEMFNVKSISFGTNELASIRLNDVKIENNLKSNVKYTINGKIYKLLFNTIDKNIIFNSLPVLGVIHLLNLDIEQALNILSNISTPARGRNNLEIVEYIYNNQKIKLNVINGVYNAVNPMTFDSGLSIMNNDYFKNNRKVCIFGGINEAGSKTEEFHLDIINKIQNSKIDVVILFNEYFKDGYNILKKNNYNVYYYNNADEVINDVKDILKNNDLVFIKSSKYNKSYKIFNYLSENNKMDLFL